MKLRWPLWRLAAFVVLPLLYLPLRAAEQTADTEEAETQPVASEEATPAADAAASEGSAADEEDEAAAAEPLERVSADNNLSFPVDI